MKIFTYCLVIFYLSLFCNVLEQEQVPRFLPDGFYVYAGKLYDANGNPFLARGVNTIDAYYMNHTLEEGGKARLKAIERAREIAHTNCVRITWNLRIPECTAENLIKTMDFCIQQKLVVIPTINEGPWPMQTNQSKDTDVSIQGCANFWIGMKDYLNRNRKYIIINVMNEFGHNHSSDHFWKKTLQTIIRKMRGAGIRNTLCLDAPYWAQGIQTVLDHARDIMKADPWQNILFGIHVYPEGKGGRKQKYGFWYSCENMERVLREAYRKQIPILFSELAENMYPVGHRYYLGKLDLSLFLRLCHEYQFGYLPWSWYGNNKDCEHLDLTKNFGATLTPWGEKMVSTAYGIKETSRLASVFTEK